MTRPAFTLVELLVVIAIIGLLSTVAVVSLSSAGIKSRNTKRTADIKQMITAFATGSVLSGSLPDSTDTGDGWVCVSSVCGDGWSGYAVDASVDAFMAIYMPQKPSDTAASYGRQRRGYLYNSGYPGGAVFLYVLEPTGTCSLGSIHSSASNYVQCRARVE